MAYTIDYTTKRKTTRNGAITIDYCPVCGRKGKYVAQGKFGSGEVRPAYYLHKETLRDGIGSMDEFCVVK